MKTPHVHAEVIKAWADGATIEVRTTVGPWQELPDIQPMWHPDQEYRVKPEPKPDSIHLRRMEFMYGSLRSYMDEPNSKFTFDGETGILKGVELIKNA